jgi:histidinol dehydrogenase
MLRIIQNPAPDTWATLGKRALIDTATIEARVSDILENVRTRGDEALLAYGEQFDGIRLDSLRVSEAELAESADLVPDKLKAAIQTAYHNIETFHQGQHEALAPVEVMPGIRCWRKSVAIERVGLYIPGGSAPLFSTVLMLGIPAKIAGCSELVLCSPPNKVGKLHPAILYAAQLVGATHIYKVGGAQAIAAMGYGTESIPQAYKIFGPGNQYVTTAKTLLAKRGVAIDMPAGPSELAVIADKQFDPAFAAADLLSQAEHGPDSQVVLITTTQAVAEAVNQALTEQLPLLPRHEVARQALQNSFAVVLPSWEEVMRFSNNYAPEHLIIGTANWEALAEQVINAGSVFLGNYAPESAGDYASGTNHTLPTNGAAKAFSGVSLDSFFKKITFQHLSHQGLSHIAEAVETMAAAEELEAHRRAVSLRMGRS